MLILSEVRPHARSGHPAYQVVIDRGDVDKILSKGALVFLHFEIVFVFGKILGHGDELVADLVPPLEGFLSPGTDGTRRLAGLALSIKTCTGEGEQSDAKRKRMPLHRAFLLLINNDMRRADPRPPGLDGGKGNSYWDGERYFTVWAS